MSILIWGLTIKNLLNLIEIIIPQKTDRKRLILNQAMQLDFMTNVVLAPGFATMQTVKYEITYFVKN